MSYTGLKQYTSLLSFLMCLATPTWAQGYSEMTPDQLQLAAIEAVDENDRQDLMAIMKEMQTREMHFFRRTRGPVCEREPEKVGYLAEGIGRHGTARQAYFTYLREHAIENGSCACLTSHLSFDGFLSEKFAFTQADLDREKFLQIRDYQNEHSSNVLSKYGEFTSNNCRRD